MGGEKRWPLVEGPPISVGRLVLMLTTVGEQLMFLMKHDIISDNGLCHKCDQVITGEWVVKGNGRYWRCKDCAVMTSCRYGTVLYQSKMKIKKWVLLALLAGKSGSIKFWTNLMSVSYHDKRLQLGFTNKMGQLDIAFKIWRSVNIFHMLFGLEFNFVIVLNRRVSSSC